jgi:hypothetical protein
MVGSVFCIGYLLTFRRSNSEARTVRGMMVAIPAGMRDGDMRTGPRREAVGSPLYGVALCQALDEPAAVELGRADAAGHHGELCRFLAPDGVSQVAGARSFCATSS